jgi:hypothetical protein
MNKDETAPELAGAKRSDDHLLQMLDESGLWLVRGGPIGVLGRSTTTLRAALHQAYEFSMQRQSPGPIVRMPDDNVMVPADQIYRLWQSLGLADR